MSILADVAVGEGANPNYGQLIISNIRYEDGSAVSIKGFLGIVFLSPASVAPRDFFYSTSPWVDIKAQTTNVVIGPSTFEVTAQLEFANAYTISPTGTRLTFGINGDLTKNPELYTTSFLFAADQLPDITGTVNIECAAAPDPDLAPYPQTLTFTRGGVATPISVPLGMTTQYKVGRGIYTITAAELTTLAQTVVAQADVSPTTVTIVTGQSVTVSVTYNSTPTKYSAIDVVMEEITPLEDEKLRVSVVVAGVQVADFRTPNPHTTQLRRLPPSSTADVGVEPLTLNNFQYSFKTKSEELSPSLFRVVFSQADLITEAVDDTGFVCLVVTVETAHGLDTTIPVRLISDPYIYTQPVKAQPGSTTFTTLVAPGTYTVQAPSFIHDGSVYFVQAPNTLTVAEDGSTELILKVQPGPNLHVRGFPSFLSFGGCTDLTDGNQADFVAARASSIFKYAGISGDGDPTRFLTDDPATSRTISLARAVEQELGDGNPVLPVMISYTCNLSGGDPETRLQDEQGLTHSFANFILSLNLATKTIDAEHPVPAGYVVNPDFLGACQQHGLTPEYNMPVRAPLRGGLDHWGVNAEIPSIITDTLRGYVRAVNWLVRTVAPAVTFGWQVNLWGVGSSTWVYESTDPASLAEKTAAYARSLAAYGDDNRPDFLAVDRYERDDFDRAAYDNGYCYGPREWGRFFDFCRALSLHLQVPAMPWQIPASRTPLVNDAVNDDFDSQHWGTGGSYIMGDPGINSDYHNVNPKILALKFMDAFPHMGKTAEEMFQRSEPFDLTEPAYLDFPLRGIFAVLLGGGSTTGIVSSIGNPEPWVRQKLATYMAYPIPLLSTANNSY